MARVRAFQNPYLGRHLSRKNIKPLKKEENTVAADVIAEIQRTLDPKTGRARYSNGGVLYCVQMLDTLPWWRRLLVPLIGEYCEIDGVKYLKVGYTNIYYRAQEWIAGRAGKSTLKVV